MFKIAIYFLAFTALCYLGLCILLYLKQEKLLFPATKLSNDHRFQFSGRFEELSIETTDHVKLHGLLFKADSSMGLVFYLHGNGGCVDSWGEAAQTYTQLDYDVFILDYRGYGKSAGYINNEAQLHSDVQTAYNVVKNRYAENQIVVLGYSLGSGLASKLASNNHPQKLILLAPYYSMKALVAKLFPYVPSLLLKYKLESYKSISAVKAPIVAFHGDQDEVIPYTASLQLQKHFKASDRLITLKGQTHNGIDDNIQYMRALREVLW